MPVLDTSFLIRLQAKDTAAQALLREIRSETLVVPPWVTVEFLTGHSRDPRLVLDELRNAFQLTETSPEWALAASAWRKELHGAKKRIRLPDFWIASFARLFDTYVVTGNVRRFRDLGVGVRTWAEVRAPLDG